MALVTLTSLIFCDMFIESIIVVLLITFSITISSTNSIVLALKRVPTLKLLKSNTNTSYEYESLILIMIRLLPLLLKPLHILLLLTIKTNSFAMTYLCTC